MEHTIRVEHFAQWDSRNGQIGWIFHCSELCLIQKFHFESISESAALSTAALLKSQGLLLSFLDSVKAIFVILHKSPLFSLQRMREILFVTFGQFFVSDVAGDWLANTKRVTFAAKNNISGKVFRVLMSFKTFHRNSFLFNENRSIIKKPKMKPII